MNPCPSGAAPGFFNNTSRGPTALWGGQSVNDAVIYIWNSMDSAEQNHSLQDIQATGTGIIWKHRDDERTLSQGKKLKLQGISQRMVEHRRTKNKHDSNKAQTRMLDPHPALLPHTSHPHQHDPTSPTIPHPQRQQGRMHPRPHWPRKRLLERHGGWETQNIPIPRHFHRKGRIQPRNHQNHGSWVLYLLYLTDSESLLKTIRKWIGERTRANLATTPDVDLVKEIVQILQERVTAGTNTFLIKIKAHRVEPLN